MGSAARAARGRTGASCWQRSWEHREEAEGRNEKEKEKKKTREKRKREKKKREAPVGFVATVGSMRQLRRNATHAVRGEQRDETVIGAGVGTADRRGGFREIRSSDGKEFRIIELNDENNFEYYF